MGTDNTAFYEVGQSTAEDTEEWVSLSSALQISQEGQMDAPVKRT